MPKKHVRVAVTTSPYLSNLSIPAMQNLVYESLLDGFLPKLMHISATSEKADERHEAIKRNPYWQEEYRSISMQEIEQRYDKILPVASQYQLDSSTFVSCLKVEHPISFKPIYHFQINQQHEGNKVSISDLDASEIFFSINTEIDTPVIKAWDDIKWDLIGVVPEKIFYRFIQILLQRLEIIFLDIAKAGKGYTTSFGFDQDLVKGTYFDVIKARFSDSE